MAERQYERVTPGTQSWKRFHKRKSEVGVVKASHPSTFKKMRCVMCHQGLAVETLTSNGKIFRCSRCGAEFGAQNI